MYRNGRKSERMIAGEERSRETNQQAPLRRIVGFVVAPKPANAPLARDGWLESLDCGHTGDWHSEQSEVFIGRRRRCRVCVGLTA